MDIQGIIDDAYALVAPYVEKDATAFCTYDEFETAVAALKSFCALREESVREQLDGTIPSADEERKADDFTLVDASALSLSDMGSMGGGPGGSTGNSGDANGLDGQTAGDGTAPVEPFSGQEISGAPDAFQPGNGQQTPGGGSSPQRPSGFPGTPPGGRDSADFAPGGFPDGAETNAVSQSDWLLLAVCAAALLLGIVFARRYRVVK